MPYARLLSTAAGVFARRRDERLSATQLAVVVEILAAHVRAGRSLRHALADDDALRPHAQRVTHELAGQHRAGAVGIGALGLHPHDLVLHEL
jgi:hypothetical protein